MKVPRVVKRKNVIMLGGNSRESIVGWLLPAICPDVGVLFVISGRLLGSNGHMQSLYGGQQPSVPVWTEGHRTDPYEQKTQQSPAAGRSILQQPAHSWK